MQKNKRLKKEITLTIVFLFFGASVIPSISGTIEEVSSIKDIDNNIISGWSIGNTGPLNGWYVQWSHTYGGEGHSQLAQPVGDIDEDGMNEVIVGGYGSMGAHILSYNENTGEYDEEYFWNYPGGWYNGVPSGACVIDLDDDGELELVVSFEYGGQDGVHAYDWDGVTLTELDYYTGIGYDFAFDVYACDYDDDEDIEVLIANSPSSSSGYQVTALKWDTAESEFVREVSWGIGAATECPMVWSGDTDNDGKTEVVASAGYNTVYALNYEDGSWTADIVGSGLAGHPYGVGVGDLDNDGIDEIGIGTRQKDAYIFDWDGSSYQEIWHTNYAGEEDLIEGIAIGDADNDGQNELLVGTDDIHVLSYNGTNYNEESTITYTEGMLAGVNIEDFDTDGFNEVKACDILGSPGKEWIIKHEAYLQADFNADITEGKAPLTVHFTDLSIAQNTEITSWEWDFDNDGIIDSEDQNPSWTYDEGGIYTVTLTVSDGTISDTETKVDYIDVFQSVLEIAPIKGGLFKINAVIKNIGQDDAIGVKWKITLEGGNILLGKVSEGEILSNILPGEQEKITSDLIIGLGKTKVIVEAWITDGPEDTRQQNAFVLLFIINVNPGGSI